MAANVWYGCEKEVRSGYELRVTGCGVFVLVADYLMLDSKMKKSVAADNFICY